ncbi:hypothetical protein FNV43_RR11745 [Rhamnella rubrinervis]|uniref:Uncharacterized protein n=1 Tax=Rhamnella rubrinervis TaxID=2594499 RepID=A0A8K0H6W7_9ROSA|nr:hypothetical protein FNV43_RR11745 [Rhamnella rubrinervis]
MKASGIWVLLLLFGTDLLFLAVSGSITDYSVPDMHFSNHGVGSMKKAISRKLKENGHNPSMQKTVDMRMVNLEDYHPIDPVPSSKASIKPGPIEHGSPIIPYIPKPSPPGHP